MGNGRGQLSHKRRKHWDYAMQSTNMDLPAHTQVRCNTCKNLCGSGNLLKVQYGNIEFVVASVPFTLAWTWYHMKPDSA